MNLQAKRENLKGRMTCGMNGHRNSIGLLLNSATLRKGRIDLFNEGTKVYTQENISFNPRDKIWMNIRIINEDKIVTFSYEAESGNIR